MKLCVRLMCLLLLVSLVASIGGCKPDPKTLKVGLVTGTVSQGEDEYRQAERLKAKFAERLIHVTYPDNFMAEQETTITRITGLAADKSVKVIVICQGVPGTLAAIDKIRQTRKDITFIVGVPHEDPKMVASKVDYAFSTDDVTRGKSIVQLAKQLGAKKFLHYSFPRHMGMEFLANRRNNMEAECKALGLEFIFVTAPDPMGPDGLPGTQKFILEDVPRQVAQHGKDIAVFGTNCGMQEPLIRACLDAGAIFPEQCCPSPTHGYPSALAIDVKGMAGNIKAILAAIDVKIVEEGGAGRFATWAVPINMLLIEAGTELAYDIIATGKKPTEADIKAKLESLSGLSPQMRKYSPESNFYLLIVGSHIFGKK